MPNPEESEFGFPGPGRGPRPPHDGAWPDELPPADPPAAEPESNGPRTRAQRWTRRLALAQGAFYFFSGVWPVLHMRSFLAVTGPKTDLWLVQTVGALLAVIGGGLLLCARRKPVGAEWHWVGAGSALVLATIDIVFVARHVIPPIYLADAAVEAALVAAWVGATWRSLAGEDS